MPTTRPEPSDGRTRITTEQLVAAAREMSSQPDPQATLQMVVDAAVDLVGGAESASLTLRHIRRHRESFETPAATNETGRLLDELQFELHEGPCVRAAENEDAVYCPDVGSDGRWPTWGLRAVEATGVRSMLCLRLFTHTKLVGALNIHSSVPDAFDDDVQDALAVAGHAAIAVSSAIKMANLAAALDSRTITGQATGVIMGRYDLDADAAFQVLVRLSSTTNRRVRDIAADIVRNRKLPAFLNPAAGVGGPLRRTARTASPSPRPR